MINQISLLVGSLIMLVGIPAQTNYYNQNPEIIIIYPEQKNYKVGEPINIKYFYTNEEGEEVKERWTYRKEDEDVNNVLYTKPDAIFTEGNYNVKLQLRDEKGNWGKAKECTLKIKGKTKQTEYEYKFGKVPIGTTIDNFKEVNYREFKTIEYDSLSSEKGTLLMSNSPEAVRSEGILYQDTVKGKGRLLVHHINEIEGEKKRLIVLAQNQESRQVEFNIRNSTFKGPSKDVLFVGQQVLYEYFKANKREHMYLGGGENYILYDSGDKGWGMGEAISGMLDFEADGPVRYIVAVTSVGASIENIDTLMPVKRDIHPRGTFQNLSHHYNLQIDALSENAKIVIGGSESEWEKGIDAINQKSCTNRGNFGILYHLNITVAEDTAVILNPRGDMFKGAINWQGIGAYLVPRYGYFPSLNRAAYLGVIKAGDTRELVYTLPCGSSAPVVIGFIPKSNWTS